MGQPLKLEVFETPEALDGPALLMPEELEELRLNAYERGYVAGWEDSGRQAEADEVTRRAAIERQAEQLNFTYHEARGHVLKSVEPLLAAMVETVLPVLARATVVPLTVEQLMPLAHSAADAPLVLRVAPGARAAFVTALQGLVLPPFNIIETPELGEGQAEFALGSAETRIDLNGAVEAIGGVIDRFYQLQNEESRRA
ncbi:MAG: flagellar biosynthesis protein [Pararhodobacter sp.]